MSAPVTFILPDLIASIPFPLRINPHCKTIGDESDQWIFSYGIYTPEEQEAFKRGRYGLLGAMCWPYAEPEYLRDCDDFGSYLFAFDDLTDSGSLVGNISGTRTAANIMMNVLYHPEAPVHSTLAHMLRDFWLRFNDKSGPGCQKRFRRNMQLYVNAVCLQAENRADFGRVMDIEPFVEHRRDTSAVKLVFALIEYALKIDFPDEVGDHPLVLSLNDACNDMLTWANDLYSFNVEQSRGDTQNLVFVVMKSVDGCDVQTAMNKIGQLIMHRLGDYLDDKANLPSWGPEIDDDVKRYCQGLEDWVIGSLQWSFQTERYFGRVVDQVRDDRTVTLLRRYTDVDAPAPEALADAVFVPTPLST